MADKRLIVAVAADLSTLDGVGKLLIAADATGAVAVDKVLRTEPVGSQSLGAFLTSLVSNSADVRAESRLAAYPVLHSATLLLAVLMITVLVGGVADFRSQPFPRASISCCNFADQASSTALSVSTDYLYAETKS